jgi:hypothetical protein
LCVNKSQFVPVIFEPPCIYGEKSSSETEKGITRHYVDVWMFIRNIPGGKKCICVEERKELMD